MKKHLWFFPSLIVLASVLWGLDGVVLTPSLYSLPVPLVVFLLHALAFVFMLPFLIYERKKLNSISRVKAYLCYKVQDSKNSNFDCCSQRCCAK